MLIGPLTAFLLISCLVLIFLGLPFLFSGHEEIAIGLLVAGLVAIVLALVSVIWDAVDDPRHGTAISKEFVPEHWSMCGKTMCYIDDHWYVTLRDGSNEGTIGVSKEEFDHIQIGSEFTGQ